MLHEALGEAKQILTDEQLERFVEIIRRMPSGMTSSIQN